MELEQNKSLVDINGVFFHTKNQKKKEKKEIELLQRPTEQSSFASLPLSPQQILPRVVVETEHRL